MLSQEADLVLVLGSQNSSNSQRLAELAQENGVPAYLIDGAADIRLDWFRGDETVLVTAGASAPELVVEDCVDWLHERFGATIEPRSIREENVSFPLPRENCGVARPPENDGRAVPAECYSCGVPGRAAANAGPRRGDDTSTSPRGHHEPTTMEHAGTTV